MKHILFTAIILSLYIKGIISEINNKTGTYKISEYLYKNGSEHIYDLKTNATGCYRCSGTECSNVNNPKIEPEPCKNSINVQSDSVRKCIQCEGNKTNSACFYQQSPENAQLCNNKKENYKETLCYTELTNKTIKRGCLNDRPASDIECNKENNCIICSGDGCNSEPALECFTCSPIHANCMKVCTSSCYTKIVNPNKVERGCFETPENEEECTAPLCQKCNENHCNNKIVCKRCNEDDMDCYVIDANNEKYNAICPNSVQCIVQIKEQRVVRSCAKINENNCTGDTCKLCSEDYCNTGFFPEDRILCHQCKGINCNNVAESGSNLKPCLNYPNNDDKCYTYGENEVNITRGCVSDESIPAAWVNGNPKYVTCKTSGCNNKKFKEDPVRKCIQCEGNRTNTACFDEQPPENAQLCNNTIEYYKKELCYTELTNETIKRGCLNDRPANDIECNKENNCMTCAENGCNNLKETINFTCIQCRSDLSPTCRNEPNKFQGSKCRRDLGWLEGCFYGTWNNIIIRGCLVDADETMQYVCKDDNNYQCFSCQGRDCNTTPASGTMNNTFLKILLLLSFVPLNISTSFF